MGDSSWPIPEPQYATSHLVHLWLIGHWLGHTNALQYLLNGAPSGGVNHVSPERWL